MPFVIQSHIVSDGIFGAQEEGIYGDRTSQLKHEIANCSIL